MSFYEDAGAAEPGPLAGTRVVDLCTARSGPTCVRQLADLGADVVQILRSGVSELEGSDAWNLHRNKRSAIVNLQDPRGREVLLRLAAKADVLVENWRPAVKYRLGLDQDTVLALNPRLIYASISGFGQDGPYADRPGLDQIAQGMGGLMSVTGPPGSGPWRVGIAVSDSVTGTFLTQGILAALLVRARTGRGQWVHTSLLESMINLMDFQAARWLIDHEVPEQLGNSHPTMPGMGTFRTSDGHINVAPINSFERFYAAIGAPELGRDPRFAENSGRRANRPALLEAIGERMRTRTTAEWVAAIGGQFPCGPVLRIDEVFEDAQVQHLRLTRTIRHPVRGEMEVLRQPLNFSETPTSIRSGPPLTGADTVGVLGDAGYSPAEIEQLLAAGVVADHAEQLEVR